MTPGSSNGRAKLGARERDCPFCSTSREGDDRYCPSCGYDFATGERFGPIIPIAPPGPQGTANGSPEPGPVPGSDGAAKPPPIPFRLMVVLSVDSSRVGHAVGQAQLEPAPRVFGLDKASLVIGRADEPNLEIPVHGDPYVSRRHAEIVELGGDWGIRDLGSTNGTRLNGAPLMGAEVKRIGADDVIELGSCTRLVVRAAEARTPGRTERGSP